MSERGHFARNWGGYAYGLIVLGLMVGLGYQQVVTTGEVRDERRAKWYACADACYPDVPELVSPTGLTKDVTCACDTRLQQPARP